MRRMRKVLLAVFVGLCLMMVALPVALFAAEAAASTPLVDWSSVIGQIITGLALPIVLILSTIVGKLLWALFQKINNPVLRQLAIDAVLFAEDKFGPDSASGKDKLAAATALLMKKTKMSQEQAEQLIRSAYQNVFAPFAQQTPKSAA